MKLKQILLNFQSSPIKAFQWRMLLISHHDWEILQAQLSLPASLLVPVVGTSVVLAGGKKIYIYKYVHKYIEQVNTHTGLHTVHNNHI